jgi:hypothetical protein
MSRSSIIWFAFTYSIMTIALFLIFSNQYNDVDILRVFEISIPMIAAFSTALAAYYAGASAKAANKSANQWREQKRVEIDSAAVIEARHAVADFIRIINEFRKYNPLNRVEDIKLFSQIFTGEEQILKLTLASNAKEAHTAYKHVLSKLERCRLLGYESQTNQDKLKLIFDDFVDASSNLHCYVYGYMTKSTKLETERLNKAIDALCLAKFTSNLFKDNLIVFEEEFNAKFSKYFDDMFKN